MSQPKWITPAGDLGTIPELDYYDFPLDAYDEAGGSLVYSAVSGTMPPGLQLVTATGRIQGIPVSQTTGVNENVSYRFTIRVTNSATKSVSDRSFTITISNIAPPVIIQPKTDLGIFLDGTLVNIQFTATEFSSSSPSLTWSLKSGNLPPGLSLSTGGLLSGYLLPIVPPGNNNGWDDIYWNKISWDAGPTAVQQTFTFTVEAYDGLNAATATYTLTNSPVSHLLGDTATITADNTLFTIDVAAGHNPIVLNNAATPIVVREGGFLAYQIKAIDLDGDMLNYSIPAIATGGFDGEADLGTDIPYVPLVPTNNAIHGDLTVDGIVQHFTPGQKIKVLNSASLANPSLYWYDATVSNTITATVTGNNVLTANVGDILAQEVSRATATVTSNVLSTSGVINFGGALVTANVGDIVVQTGSNAYATVTASISNATWLPVQFVTVGNVSSLSSNVGILPLIQKPPVIVGFDADVFDTAFDAVVPVPNATTLSSSGQFTFGSGNVYINGVHTSSYPVSATVSTTIPLAYTSENLLKFNLLHGYGNVTINNIAVNASPTLISSIGITQGLLSAETETGFDDSIFDQSLTVLPGNITLYLNSGWLTGQIGSQTVAELDYPFQVSVYKRDNPTYITTETFTLSVLGDINNTISWVTPTFVGTIHNGSISNLSIVAVSAEGRQLHYSLTHKMSDRLPQGLKLLSSGNLSGRVSFESFSLDNNATTIDGGAMTFDYTYTFNVTAADYAGTVSATKQFTIQVIKANDKPYEDLYLKALPSMDQRLAFTGIMNDTSIFPNSLIYRADDPFFGIATDIKTLFLSGLSPSTLSQYAAAVKTNHYNKNIRFGNIKTARAQDANFNTLYEVVYVEAIDSTTGSANGVMLTDFPVNGTTLYPNADANMSLAVASKIGYENKGALPAWMTSKQADGSILGFTRAIVLAYTVPNASELIAYRLQQSGFDFNQIDFEVDRYELDNQYTVNFNIATSSFIKSAETTFDRYPALPDTNPNVGNATFAVSTAFELIDNCTVSDIIARGGLDGIKVFETGNTLVFAKQEYTDIYHNHNYNTGWAQVLQAWDSEDWDLTQTISEYWDASNYVPGYEEHMLNPNVINKRAGIWEITIDASNIVHLTFVKAVNNYESVYVVSGYTYGGTNIYYDPIVKTSLGYTLPNYSIISQTPKAIGTTFDGNSTLFFNNRDVYTTPENSTSYIKFPQANIYA